MNFLKSVLSSASGFPGYTLGEKIELPSNCIYTLHNATVRESGAPCSVFTFETSKAATLLPLAKNYHAKSRSLKLPGVVKFLDSLETEAYIYIATERVSPLSHTLSKNPSTDLITWGLYSVATTISFINSEAMSVHGNLRTSSIYTTESGEWKVAGFEALTCMKDDDPFVLRYASLVPDIYTITPPELQNKGFSELRNLAISSLDSWQFACLVWSCFNGPFTSATALSGQGKIPKTMFAQYRRLLSPTAASRLPVSNFVDFGRRPGGFFRSDLIEISEAIPNLPLKPKEEVEAFLAQNMKVIAALPSGFTKNKLLPELVKSLEFGGGGSTALAAILTIAKDLSPADIEALITPILLRIWSSKDRSIHLILLENLKEYLDYLSPKQINDKLFPAMGTAFTDPAPIMRETAIRQVMIITPHLSDRNINGDLLKYLAKTANDQQPGIRTNTTICLGKISSHLGAGSKRKVLTAAFSRSLKDPFVHARLASLQAINATADVYDKEDLANRLMPGLMPLLIDPERNVREQARRTLNTLLEKLTVLTQAMPETLSTAMSSDPAAPVQSSASSGGAMESAGVWAGWAVSTLSRNLEASTLASSNSGTSSLPVTRSATPANDARPSTPTLGSTGNVKERPTNARAGSGLKLSSNKAKKVDLSSIYAEEFGSGGDAWGADAWDVDDDAKEGGNKTGLAKPLVKSDAKVIKVVPGVKAGKSSTTKTAKTAKAEAEEDWDTDAW